MAAKLTYTTPIGDRDLYEGVRKVLLDFMSIPKPSLFNDQVPAEDACRAFEAECWAEAYHRNYDMDILSKYLDVGIVITNSAYFYQSHDIQLYIALFTGLLTCIDDNFVMLSDGIRDFMGMYTRGERHRHNILNNVTDILSDTSRLFCPIASNFIIASAFAFLNGMMMESLTPKLNLVNEARRYPQFLRIASGISKAYAAFIFRPETSIPPHYVHAFPELEDTINFTNDILSFYKEELEGEEENTVSLVAKLHGRTNLEQLHMLVSDVCESHRRTSVILKDHEDVYHDYVRFWAGYTLFHTSSKRYRLTELGVYSNKAP